MIEIIDISQKQVIFCKNIRATHIFAKNDLFLAYVNNFNHYVSYYRNTYQHGGISLEEMIIPFLVFNPK